MELRLFEGAREVAKSAGTSSGSSGSRKTYRSGKRSPRARIDVMIERPLEKLLLVSRWLFACFFFPLLVSLAALVVKSVQRLFEAGPLVFSMSEALLIVEVLKLVELTLTGARVVIMIFAGYANFVTWIDLSGHKDWTNWMTQVDFSCQKLWLMSAII